ncbi:MAG: bifunctional serine/threonine-protein kinase/ABC transporter substrate-binding protein [Anaerolineae bacterium]|nr:bifunctional serine/threonine-protein kinase/ABC transporter substrate-binding protein [Anaerolineae bacterium]
MIYLATESSRQEFRKRFEKEAETIALLEHPHILPVFDYGITESVAYLAMRLVRGGTLEGLVQERPLSLDEMAHIFEQVAHALDYAHRHGVIHRDLKPSNVLLDQEQHAYLSDFGVAKMIGSSAHTTITVAGKVVGTPAYMAPEQLRGMSVDHRADIYSLGMVLHYMLTRRILFEGESPLAVIYQLLEEEPTPPRAINPDTPQAVETVVMRALEKDPARRFDSADEMAQALNAALGRVTTPRYGSATATPSRADNTVRISRLSRLATSARHMQRPLFWGLAGVIALFIVIVALVWARPALAPSFHPPTVVAGERSGADAVTPTIEEIALAAQYLGEDGFIAYIVCNQRTEFFAAHAREMSDIARQYELRFRVYDSENDAYNETVQIERARTDGARAMIVCVLDPDLLADALAAIDRANIPLVLNNVGGATCLRRRGGGG